MYVTFSGTVSFFWIPITFIHSETKGQHWVTPSLHKVLCVRPPRILVWLSWTAELHLSYCLLSRPSTRLIWMGQENWSICYWMLHFLLDVISQKNTLLSAVSLCRVHSMICIPQTLTTASKQDRLHRQRQDVRHPQNSPPLRRKSFQKARKPDKTEYHSSKL